MPCIEVTVSYGRQPVFQTVAQVPHDGKLKADRHMWFRCLSTPLFLHKLLDRLRQNAEVEVVCCAQFRKVNGHEIPIFVHYRASA